VQNTPSNRAAWRHVLLTNPDLKKYISGVIVTEETFYQQQQQQGNEDSSSSSSTADATSSSSSQGANPSSAHSSSSPGAAAASSQRLIQNFVSQGVAVGVKVDRGLTPLNPDTAAAAAAGPTETQTQGLDGLLERCQRYASAGAAFVKWRAVFRVDVARGWPSEIATAVNAEQLAQYAAAAQAAGLVPVVEPEVLVMDGGHDLQVSEAASTRVLSTVVKTLLDHDVLLEGIVLKPAMVLPGSSSSSSSRDGGASVADVAAAALRVLRRTVPPAVPGIAFLSGGQSEQLAAQHLAAINNVTGGVCNNSVTSRCCSSRSQPWVLTFSYGRALQASALAAWAKAPHDAAAVHAVFNEVAAAAAAAALRAG